MPPSDEQKQVIMNITIKMVQLGYEVVFQEPITTGPMVTTYRFMPKHAAKVASISNLAADIALSLAVEDVVIRRLPGEAVIGVTVPNATRTVVNWRDTMKRPPDAMSIPINFGVDQHGQLFREDLCDLPHLLIAGSTGSGKSTLLSSLIASLLYWRSPDQIRLYLADTKQVEFGQFKGVPHLAQEPMKTKYETWEVMDKLIDDTENRLKALAASGAKNILEYNSRRERKMAHKVLIIDELFDVLGGEDGKETKISNIKLQTIVGRSRASGIHVIAATQRSSVDVIKGTAKSNFPARVSFRLPSEIDSRTILGHSGAEHLLARGDMWYVSPSRPAMLRLHSAYASADDIHACVQMASMNLNYNINKSTNGASHVNVQKTN